MSNSNPFRFVKQNWAEPAKTKEFTPISPDPEVEIRLKYWQAEYMKEKDLLLYSFISETDILNWLAKDFIMTRIK